ncbi:uncharacterized protein N7459_005604 [Penicillium hispanicum]|uniref:uncharacterized protein n=1 Tax=Penicillium hispanicum TaxID=1080232 RepID=UPI002540F169|nr:uncharacterized protein N7459_005604 [Penicillium hispanicum]KAJ5579619.1 hypothetical protein N7459_005604 [Penicillium hispanicum]
MDLMDLTWDSPSASCTPISLSACSTSPASSITTLSAMIRTPPPQSEPFHVLGNLDALPLDILWMIFDELLTGSRCLTHSGLCALRNLALTNRAAAFNVRLYMVRNAQSGYVKTQLASIPIIPAATHTTLFFDREDAAPITGHAEVEPDVLTAAILDQCDECFTWLCHRIPQLQLNGQNEFGWSFLAIAAHSGSMSMFKHILTETQRSSRNNMYTFLQYRANSHCLWPQVIGILAQQRDLQFLEDLFDFLGPPPSNLGRATAFDRSLSNANKYRLCTFATPALAETFAQLRVHLDLIWPSRATGGATSYHAAVSNGPAFLDYIRRRSEFPIDIPDNAGETPLHYAVRANRLDSVQWLTSHGGAPDLYTTRSIKTATHLAARLTSNESEAILHELLTAFDAQPLSSYSVGTLLCTLAEGVRETLLTHAVRSDIDYEGFVAFGQHHENLAMRKCNVIVRASGRQHVTEQTEASTNTPLTWSSWTARQHNEAREAAVQIGFDGLALTMTGFGAQLGLTEN